MSTTLSPFHLVYSMYSYIFCINSYVYVSLSFFFLYLPCLVFLIVHFFNNYSCDLFHWAEFIYTAVQRERAAVHV